MYDPLETKRKEGKSSERVGQYLEFNALYVNRKFIKKNIFHLIKIDMYVQTSLDYKLWKTYNLNK